MPTNNNQSVRTPGPTEAETERKASMSPIEGGTSRSQTRQSEALDDQGTTADEALEILRQLRDEVFGLSDEKLALALGRSADEVENWMSGNEEIDADALLKARRLASERGVDPVEHN